MKRKISLLAPDLSGGGGTRVYLLAQVLRKLNYEVNVCGFLFGEKLYPQPPLNLSVKWVRGYDYPRFVNSIGKLLREIDGDILYAVKPRVTSFGIALLKQLQSRQPVILDIDDWELSWFGGDNWQYRPTAKQFLKDIFKSDGVLRNPDYPLYLKGMEKLINRADAVTVDTKFLQTRFGGSYLPNGKDTCLFNPQNFDPQVSREKYGLANYRLLMFPGTARPHKGLEDVLMALEELNQPDFRLVIVGGREIGDGYLEYLQNRWQKWLIKLPQSPIEEMPEIVAAAHLIVVPQRSHPTAKAQFPIKLTDGMAMAKPILATRVGDIPEILGETGYLVDADSPAQLAERIQWIFEHLDEANVKGLQGRERCIKYYSIETMGEQLSRIIDNIAILNEL